MPYLVDTDVLIDVSRSNEAAIDFLDQLGDFWLISIITALELIVGARSKKEVAQIDQLIAAYSAIPLTAKIGNSSYALLRQFAKSHGLRVFDSHTVKFVPVLQYAFCWMFSDRPEFATIAGC